MLIFYFKHSTRDAIPHKLGKEQLQFRLCKGARETRPTHWGTDANLYPPERQLTKASEPSFNLEGQRSNLTSEDS